MRSKGFCLLSVFWLHGFIGFASHYRDRHQWLDAAALLQTVAGRLV
jgi:hypothetical protein